MRHISTSTTRGWLRILATTALATTYLTSTAAAQEEPRPRPFFTWLFNALGTSSTSLPTWTGTYMFQGKTYSYNMVGTSPNTNTSTTIPVYLIPIKIVLTRLGSPTFDPMSIPANTGGRTALQNTVMSPIFDSTTTYIQGGVNVGTTQYIDAFQRANFWGTVNTNPNYHLLLGTPTVLPEVTLVVPFLRGKTGSPFGETVAEVDINWIDAQFQTLIKLLGIQPDSLPIFMTYQTYLTQSGGCCIGGYHSANGAQSYAHFTYIDQPGLFAQDVSALSHEIGEWADDPLIANPSGNRTPCGVLEVGDPLETEPNFGGVPYSLNGFTYNLQDLVTLPWFGAPPSTSVNGFFTFQGQPLGVCQPGA